MPMPRICLSQICQKIPLLPRQARALSSPDHPTRVSAGLCCVPSIALRAQTYRPRIPNLHLDPRRVRNLADQMIEFQQRDIVEMKALNDELDGK